MVKKILVVGFILLGANQSVYAQDATQVAVNEAGHLRIVEIKDRAKSQREEIELALAKKTITTDQAKDCGDNLDKIEAQVEIIASSDNGNGIMLADDYDSYTGFLDVNASLIGDQEQLAVVASSKGPASNS